jgi:hypothetical protein
MRSVLPTPARPELDFKALRCHNPPYSYMSGPGEREPQGEQQSGFDLNKLRELLQRQEQREERLGQLQEEAAQREEAFTQTALYFDIPEKHHNHPEVRRFVEIVNLIGQAALRIPEWATGRDVTPHIERSVDMHLSLGPTEGAPAAGEVLGRKLDERYAAAFQLLHAASNILSEGVIIGTDPASPIEQSAEYTESFLVDPVNKAFKRYGKKLVDDAGGV